MKAILFISFFSFFTSVLGYSQITIQSNVSLAGITVEFLDYDSTIAKNAQDVIENFNPDKITLSRFNHAQEKFFIKHTPLLDKVELLAIFRDAGMEPFYIENNIRYTLNTTATALVTSSASTPIVE
jgi:hypothetical protein